MQDAAVHDASCATKSHVVINLLPCPRFVETLASGRGQYIFRYRKKISLPELLEQSLNFIWGIPGDELYERIFDAYDYDQTKKYGLRVTAETERLLYGLRLYLNETTEIYRDHIVWNDRSISCAAMFLLCNTLINHNDRPLVLPSSDRSRRS